MNRKYATDTLWVSGSFGVQAAAGALINFAILYALGSEALGVFNQLYAIYAISGQLAVFGIHDSGLKHVAEVADPQEGSETGGAQDAVRLGAFACAVCLGLVGSLALAALSHPLGAVLDSPSVRTGVLYLAPGLLFFVVNKVLIYLLNGQRRMGLFAVASGCRAVVILGMTAAIILRFPAPEYFGLAFTLAEVAVFLLVLWQDPIRLTIPWRPVGHWIRKHLQFGSRSFAHSMVSEAFIRVDVLVLGVFLSDSDVGIYSFAAFFAEGIYQVPVIVRNMNNPILVRLLLERNGAKIAAFARRTGLLSVAMTSLVAGSVAVIYPWLDAFFDPQTIRASTPVIWILASGMVLYSLFVPFDFIFLTAGRPGTQSWFMLGNMAFNVVLNLILIPRYGLVGASMATVASFAFAGVMLNVLSVSVLRLPRGPFFAPREPLGEADASISS